MSTPTLNDVGQDHGQHLPADIQALNPLEDSVRAQRTSSGQVMLAEGFGQMLTHNTRAKLAELALDTKYRPIEMEDVEKIDPKWRIATYIAMFEGMAMGRPVESLAVPQLPLQAAVGLDRDNIPAIIDRALNLLAAPQRFGRAVLSPAQHPRNAGTKGEKYALLSEDFIFQKKTGTGADFPEVFVDKTKVEYNINQWGLTLRFDQFARATSIWDEFGAFMTLLAMGSARRENIEVWSEFARYINAQPAGHLNIGGTGQSTLRQIDVSADNYDNGEARVPAQRGLFTYQDFLFGKEQLGNRPNAVAPQFMITDSFVDRGLAMWPQQWGVTFGKFLASFVGSTVKALPGFDGVQYAQPTVIIDQDFLMVKIDGDHDFTTAANNTEHQVLMTGPPLLVGKFVDFERPTTKRDERIQSNTEDVVGRQSFGIGIDPPTSWLQFYGANQQLE